MKPDPPTNLLSYCAAKGLQDPRIVPTVDHYRALATHPQRGVVLVPTEVYWEEIGDEA